MEQKLTYSSSLVNEWLRYAEAKNGVLIALSAGALIATANALASVTSLSAVSKVLGICTMLTLAISCWVALFSFVPRVDRLKPSASRKGVKNRELDNLIFFSYLCKYTPEELLDSIALLYFQNDKYPMARQKSDLDLADQIIINSRITVAKFFLFRIAVWTMIIAVPFGVATFSFLKL
jgi:hypothetical protein